MANKIYIEYKKTTAQSSTSVSDKLSVKITPGIGTPNTYEYKETTIWGPEKTTTRLLVSSLLEDITIDVQSQFGSYGEMVPGLSNIVHLMSTLSATGGKVGEGILNFTNQLDAARWERTDPTRVTVKLGFFTKDNPYLDVVEPVASLTSLSILAYDPVNKSYSVPGINLKDSSNFTKKSGNSSNFVGSKFCSVWIPGIIYLPIAYVEKATPTYSKQVTEEYYPLWSTLELILTSTYPALESDFTESAYYSNYKVLSRFK